MASVEGDAATEAPRAAMESGVAATEEGGTSRTQHQLPAGEFDLEEQPENNTEEDDDDYLRNPLPENEYVGVDEEIMYLDIVPVNAVHGAPVHASGCSEKEKEKALAEDGSEDESEDGSEDEFEDEDEIEGDEDQPYEEVNPHPIAGFDEVDPPMEVGTTYRSMYVFKLALCQHAIKHEFEFNTEKSSKTRFRAYCSRKVEDNCPWRLHASTTADKCTVMVKKNEFAHDCSSTRRKKRIKNATKHWICWKVNDFLIEDATLGAKALLQKIKEHHNVSLEITGRKKGKQGYSNSGASKRSRSGSNQPEPLSIELPTSKDKPEVVVKLKGKRRKKEVDKNAAKKSFVAA